MPFFPTVSSEQKLQAETGDDDRVELLGAGSGDLQVGGDAAVNAG